MTEKEHEVWFLVGDKFRFSLWEYCLVTGLNCGDYPSDEVEQRMFKADEAFVKKLSQYSKKT